MGSQSLQVKRSDGSVERGWLFVRYDSSTRRYHVRSSNGMWVKYLTATDILAYNKHIRGCHVDTEQIMHRAKPALWAINYESRFEKESAHLVDLKGETCHIKITYKVTADKNPPRPGVRSTQKWTWVTFERTVNIKEVFIHV